MVAIGVGRAWTIGPFLGVLLMLVSGPLDAQAPSCALNGDWSPSTIPGEGQSTRSEQFRNFHLDERATDGPTPLWLTAGVGATNGMAGVVAGSLLRGGTVFSLRMVDTWEGGVVDVGVLYGRVLSTTPIYVSLSGGLGPVFGRRISTTVGVPLEGQVFLRRSIFGIGAYGFGNVNPEESFVGLAVSVQVGRFAQR